MNQFMQSIAYTKNQHATTKKCHYFMHFQFKFNFNTIVRKKIKNCQMNSKNRQNLTLHNSSYLMTTKKITSKTPTRTSL